MRKLAHIETITWKKPIEGADRIELVGVLGWQCIAKLNEFQVGDKCVYIEIDSIVDKDNPDFAFLEVRHYKIKTQKMRGVLSQGIVFPMSILKKSENLYNISDDVTAELKITEVEDEVPKETPDKAMQRFKQTHKRLCRNKLFRWLMRFSWFRKIAFATFIRQKKPKKFPDWITKTDEIRIQNMPWVLDDYRNIPMVVTEKLDGTSTSFGLRKEKKRKYDFAVCSRQVRQADAKQKSYYDTNVYWEMASKYDIKDVLIKIAERYNATIVVLQGETIGDGIQSNKYKLKGHDFYGFNLTIDGNKVDSVLAADLLNTYGVKWVPIIDDGFILKDTVDEMLNYADANSVLLPTLREGVVIRDHNNTTSFKCISNKFLLKHNL
jgi:hypothetical protein